MSGSFLHRSWEISSVPEAQAAGGAGKAESRNLSSTRMRSRIHPYELRSRRTRGCSLRRWQSKGV
jgi:hypothetical protein